MQDNEDGFVNMVYEPGLYVNFYKDRDGRWIESQYFESPLEAKNGIAWSDHLEYQFTALVTKWIYKYDRS
jgi:hypothetical protein